MSSHALLPRAAARNLVPYAVGPTCYSRPGLGGVKFNYYGWVASAILQRLQVAVRPTLARLGPLRYEDC